MWAVEVTMGKRKNTESLSVGRSATNASRAFIVYQQAVGRPDLQGVAQHGSVDRLTLRDALTEIQAML